MSFDNSDTVSNSQPSPNNPPPASTPQDQQAPITAQDTTAQSTQSQGTPNTAPSGPGAQQSPQRQQNPQQQNPGQQMVSNTPPPDPVASHPLVQKAGILHAVATALSGGQRYTERIDDNGNRIRTPIKMSGGQVAMAIALEAISGSLTGLAAGRGHGAGAAGAAAFAQAAARRQAETDKVDQKAQDDYANRSKAIANKAQIAEVNSRTLLNTSEAEKFGSEALDKLVQINRASAALDVDPSSLDNDGQPMTQQDLLAGIQSGKISSTDHIGPVAGRVEVTDRDGNRKWEATHLVIKDPNTPMSVSQEAFDRYAAGKVPGFPAGAKLGPNGVQIKLALVQHANEVLASHTLTDFRLKDMKDVLAGTQFAEKVPNSVDFSKPGVESAMQKLQRYVSHSNQHGMDLYESLQAMGSDKRDPQTGQMQPNPDAKYVDTIASAMGGWPVLEAVHNKLAADKKTAEKQAEADVEIKKEKALIPIKAATAGAEAKARSAATMTSPKNEDGSWNMGSIPVQLVEGGMDPSQLSKRSADYNAKLEAASAYSLARYGRPFDIAQATTDYKQANNPQVQGMLKMVGAMSAPNGELAIAVNAAKALPQLNSSLVNKVFNISETQFGSPAATNFHTAMIGFSDLYAKVMGGGVGTDALRQSAMDVLKDGYSRGQIAGSISVLQQQIEARKSQMIGANPYLRKQFGGQEQSQSPSNVQAPPATSLKEGVATRFANGQTWTLRGGQPVQVQQ